MTAINLTPQVAQERFTIAQAELARENEAALRLERRRDKIGKDLGDIEKERKALAVAAVSGNADAKTSAAQLAVRRGELTNELELIEAAIPEIRERLQPFIRTCEEARTDVFEAQMEISGTRLMNAGSAVDNQLQATVAALMDFYRAIEELAALGSNQNPVLAVQNRLIEEVVSRLRGRDVLDAAVANVPYLSGLLDKPVHVHAAAIKPIAASVTELAESHLRRR